MLGCKWFYQFPEISHLRWVAIKDVINAFSGYSISSDLHSLPSAILASPPLSSPPPFRLIPYPTLSSTLPYPSRGAVARSEACPFAMQAAPSSIPTSGAFFRGDLVMKTNLRPFYIFRWFKKNSCQLLAKECALSTGKLPRILAQEQSV